MVKPVIMTVDDDPQVLAAIERDLRRQYSSEYRIVRAGSGSEALEALVQLRKRGTPVALLVADQRMPEMSGTEFLAEARKLVPDVKKALLTAYADTEAAIASINAVGLDYYFMKPWDPPEQNLYPVLDGLLADWTATAAIPYDGIRVAGTLWSHTTHAVKDFLARNRIPYLWLDIDHDPPARELALAQTGGELRLPVIFFPDGSTLVAPDRRELAEKAGLQVRATQPTYDLIVVGGGPAGLAASMVAASEGLRTILIEREATGGQAGMSSRIENYLGFPNGLSGAELAQRATVQARKFGAEILTSVEATGVRVEQPYKIVTLSDGSEISGKALVVATGVSIRRLEVPGADAVTGAGLYYGAAVTEAVNYREQHVYIIGGANSAGQGAMFLSRYAKQVTLVVRGASIGMSSYLVKQIQETPNIDIMPNTEVAAVHGTEHLEAMTVRRVDTGEEQRIPAAAMFVFIGAMPYSDLVSGVVERDEAGFILTGFDLPKEGDRPRNWRLKRDPFLLESSVPGIFAAGDVRKALSKRVAGAVGDGGVVVSFIHHYLRTI